MLVVGYKVSCCPPLNADAAAGAALVGLVGGAGGGHFVGTVPDSGGGREQTGREGRPADPRTTKQTRTCRPLQCLSPLPWR